MIAMSPCLWSLWLPAHDCNVSLRDHFVSQPLITLSPCSLLQCLPSPWSLFLLTTDLYISLPLITILSLMSLYPWSLCLPGLIVMSTCLWSLCLPMITMSLCTWSLQYVSLPTAHCCLPAFDFYVSLPLMTTVSLPLMTAVSLTMITMAPCPGYVFFCPWPLCLSATDSAMSPKTLLLLSQSMSHVTICCCLPFSHPFLSLSAHHLRCPIALYLCPCMCSFYFFEFLVFLYTFQFCRCVLYEVCPSPYYLCPIPSYYTLCAPPPHLPHPPPPPNPPAHPPPVTSIILQIYLYTFYTVSHGRRNYKDTKP